MSKRNSNEHLKPVLLNERAGNNTEQDTTKSKKAPVWLFILIPLVLIAVVWIWKDIQIKNARETAAKERAALEQTAKREIISNSTEHLRLLSMPMVWAIRTEMLQGNISQVHLYLNEMVKQKHFKNVAIADAGGKIISSTNKKFEGQPFTALADSKYLSINNTMVDNNNDSLLMMASPVMGFDKRLGTMFVTYELSKPAFTK